jgi:hypothetical protein
MSGRLRAARLKILSQYRPIPPGERQMVVTFRRPLLCSAAGMRATTLARIGLRRSPCSPLPRFLEGAPVGLLWPSSRATLLPSEALRLSLQTPGCLDPPAPACYLASHRELSGGRQCFWACISFGLPHSPLPDCRLTRDFLPEIMVLAVAVVVAAVVVGAWGAAPP